MLFFAFRLKISKIILHSMSKAFMIGLTRHDQRQEPVCFISYRSFLSIFNRLRRAAKNADGRSGVCKKHLRLVAVIG